MLNNYRIHGLIIAGLNLTAQSSQAQVIPPTTGSDPAKEITALNSASKLAIESQWIKIPPLCKDRSFSSEPVRVTMKPLPFDIQNIHLELESLG